MGGGGGRGAGSQLGLARGWQLSQKLLTAQDQLQRRQKKSSLLTKQGIKKNVALCVNLVTGVAEFMWGRDGVGSKALTG